MNDAAGSILQVEDLTKEFGGLRAVDSLSFQVQEGEILGFIGPNGAGKSTTFNCITGFLEPTSGEISFQGTDITGASPHEIVRQGIGRTFQDFKPLEDWPVIAHVVLGLLDDKFLSLKGKKDSTQFEAAQICYEVGLDDRMMQTPDELPHAGLIRLELAKAMATSPDLMLIDEVFAGLSADEVKEISELLRKLRDEEDVTLIVVDHNMRGLLELVDRVVVIQFGTKIAEGTPEEITQNEKVKRAYLGTAGEENADTSDDESDPETTVGSGEDREESTSTDESTENRNSVSDNGILVVDGLDLSFDGSVDGQVTFSIADGAIHRLEGDKEVRNAILEGIIGGDRSSDGTVWFKGREVTPDTDTTDMGLIRLSEVTNHPPDDSVLNIIRSDLISSGRSEEGSVLEDWARAICRRLNLDEQVNCTSADLSREERIRLTTARAIVKEPDCLIIDKWPDEFLGDEYLASVLESLRDHGMTILVPSNESATIDGLPDRTVSVSTVRNERSQP